MSVAHLASTIKRYGFSLGVEGILRTVASRQAANHHGAFRAAMFEGCAAQETEEAHQPRAGPPLIILSLLNLLLLLNQDLTVVVLEH
jgi:hypothetical protein